MCTVLLKRDATGVIAVMNRDEKRDRVPEGLPRIDGDDPRFVAPRDGARGGTWIGVNDRALVVFLLNGYGREDASVLGRRHTPSRGELVLQMLGRDYETARRFALDQFDPGPYPSFDLVLASTAGASVFTWRRDGEWSSQPLADDWQLLTSSSWRSRDVIAWRRDRFDQWCADGRPMEGSIPTFNLLESPGRRQWSPMMSRDESATRSITRVEVDRASGRADLTYWQRTDAGLIVHQPDRRIEVPLVRSVEAA